MSCSRLAGNGMARAKCLIDQRAAMLKTLEQSHGTSARSSPASAVPTLPNCTRIRDRVAKAACILKRNMELKKQNAASQDMSHSAQASASPAAAPPSCTRLRGADKAACLVKQHQFIIGHPHS